MKLVNMRIVGLTLLIGLVFASCQDIVTYNDGYNDGTASTGVPKILAIYDVGDTACITPLSEGSLEEMLHITGSNLSGVKKVMFNDVEVPLSGIYAKAENAYLQIPRVIPGEVTNKLVYTTELGEITYDFAVNTPELEVDGLYNEFALPGDTVEVNGNYFDLYGFTTDNSGAATITLNNENVTIDSLTSEYMSIIIPKNAPDNAIISFNYIAPGDVQTTKNIPYRQVQTLIWPDLANYSQYGIWGGSGYITDGAATGEPTPLYGSYVRVKGSFSAWSWNNLPCGGFNFSNEDAANNQSDYYFKFEVNSASSSPFYSSTAGYIFQLNGGWYVWNPSSDISFNTYGKWQTIEIPLSNVATAGLSTGWTNFYFILQPSADWSLEHNFTNFRIEKKSF